MVAETPDSVASRTAGAMILRTSPVVNETSAAQLNTPTALLAENVILANSTPFLVMEKNEVEVAAASAPAALSVSPARNVTPGG